jgi:hypothetical protein
MHCIHHELCLGIRLLPKNCHFLALFEMLEEAFQCLIRQESRFEDCVIVPKGGASWLAVRHLELHQYYLDAHCRIPTLEVGIVGHLEDIVYVFVQHAEQGMVYVVIQQIEIFVVVVNPIGRFDGNGGCKLVAIVGDISWIQWRNERIEFKHRVHLRVHCKIRPSVDKALRAVELL